MEILITLVLIGLVVMLFPYIIGGVVIVLGLFVGAAALVFAGVSKLFGR
jgi:hypothetical protein